MIKYHPNKSVLMMTFSIEEGLLLLSNPLCEGIIKSCLASAQRMHPLKICHFLVNSTHIHLVVVVMNPDDVSGFVRYFKTESARRINAVLGRDKRTVWCEGYDSPVVLTPIRALMAISYIYANPAKDNLEVSIEKYPGVSSWKMFLKGEYSKHWKLIRRPAYVALTKDSHNLRGYTKESQRVAATSKTTLEFRIEPNAWLEAFGINTSEDQAKWNQILINRVRALERRAERKRIREKKSVIGQERLINQKLDTGYRPKRKGKRMWCLSEDRQMRIGFINFLKELISEAKEIRKRWMLGDFSVPFPLGLYPPSMPKLAEPMALS